MTTQTNFEDRLLHQLRQVVRDNPEPPVARRRVAVPRRLVVASGVAAAVVAAVLVASSGGGSNAYALETQPDGSVTVHISSLADAGGLQSKLRAAGIPAVVDYTADCAPDTAPAPADGGPSLTRQGADTGGPVTQQAGAPPAKGDVARMKVTSSVSVDGDGTTFTLDPGHIPQGAKVFITTSTGKADSIGIAIGEQRPPGCTPAP